MFCPTCGAQVAPDLKFCPTCGAIQPGQVAPPPPPQVPFPGYSPVQAPGPFVPPVVGQVETGKWIGEGWRVVTSDAGNVRRHDVGLTASLLSAVPLVLHAPMMAGFYIGCIRKLRRGTIDVADLFKGFNYFVPALVVLLLSGLFAFIGSIFCIIPGLVIAAMYQFAILFVVDKKLDFWPAMEASHAVVKQNYVGFTLFLLACVLFNILGALALLVGLLITVPVTFVAVTAAYRDIVGFDPNSEF